MQDFRKRRNKVDISRMALGCLGAAALVLVAFFAIRAAWGMYIKFAAASEAQSQAERQLASLQDQYGKLQTQVAALASPRGVEAQARQRYGVALPDEGEIDIVRDTASTTSKAAPQEGWWQKLWHAVFVW